ncbi:MAG: ABC transporter transmembrane domain-containing protein [Hyphomicrobiaceae bacterium]|nr:ABC transporter transmembrane domain-containing protein [Hyphomicrobiaceae bacterium]
MRPLVSLLPLIGVHRGMLAVAAVALIASALALLAVPVAIRRVIDAGFTSTDGRVIDTYFIGLIGLGGLLAIASATRFYCVNWLGERVVADLRSRVLTHLALLGPSFFEKNRSGEIMSRITADTTQITSAAGSALSQAVRNAIMLAGALTMMVVTSARLSGLVLVAIPLIVLPLVAYGRSVRRLSRSAQDTLAEAAAYAAENLSAHRTMQAYTSETHVSRRYAEAIERSFAAARARMMARAGLTALVIFLVIAGIVGVLWHGAGLVAAGGLSAGQLGQFVLYAVFAGSSLAGLSEVWGEVQQAAGAAERIGELMATEPEIRSPAVPTPLPLPPQGHVAFENVSFAYSGRSDAPTLDRLTFEARPGETVAIVGPSGAGKSTVLALLLRFFDPSSGEIRLDGVPIREAGLDELRRRIALVPQDVALFADTVTENIRYGAPDASRAEVERAAITAHADGFIRALPDGYETRLGERGVTLSGGQRQRIAIARAILRNAPVLLLDEATSALDAESEVAVQQALDALRKGRTTLVVAHRLATVQRADRILVMDGGLIVEAGTHAELVAKGGLYARLAELQFGASDAMAAQ